MCKTEVSSNTRSRIRIGRTFLSIQEARMMRLPATTYLNMYVKALVTVNMYIRIANNAEIK